jgi:pyruvate,water dikinase
MLSHAAIVGREYGVPTVTAVGVATLAIGDGDLIEVDGTNGRVTILKKAREIEPS